MEQRISSQRQTSSARRTILVVEDEPLMLGLMEKYLLAHGYQVFSAADGNEAIEVYCRHKLEINVVLLDLGLPRVTGQNVFLKMREENPNVRIVVASGYLDPESLIELQQAGIERFIQKPYRLNQVLAIIQSLIET